MTYLISMHPQQTWTQTLAYIFVKLKYHDLLYVCGLKKYMRLNYEVTFAIRFYNHLFTQYLLWLTNVHIMIQAYGDYKRH